LYVGVQAFKKKVHSKPNIQHTDEYYTAIIVFACGNSDERFL